MGYGSKHFASIKVGVLFTLTIYIVKYFYFLFAFYYFIVGFISPYTIYSKILLFFARFRNFYYIWNEKPNRQNRRHIAFTRGSNFSKLLYLQGKTSPRPCGTPSHSVPMGRHPTPSLWDALYPTTSLWISHIVNIS